MLRFKHKNIKVFFFLLFAVMLLARFWHPVSLWVFVVLPFVFLAITLIGSYFIQWNYFYPSLNSGNRNQNKIAISFDDAPMQPHTAQVLDLLQAYKIKATFFLIGKQIEGNHLLIKRMINEGHTVGNHSYSHANSFPIFSIKKMLEDVRLCDSEIEKVIGKKPLLFRPPFGVTNPRIAAVVKAQKYYSIGWSLRSYDTSISSRNYLLHRCTINLKNGDIVLFHDWGKHTLAILPQWLDEVKKKGLEIVPLTELLGINAYKQT